MKTPKNSDKPKLQAKHGLSFFIAGTIDDDKVTVMMDTGPSSNAIQNNVDTMKINVDDVDVISLSHGHYDHTGGLIEALKQMKKWVPVIWASNAFRSETQDNATSKANRRTFQAL